MLGSSRQEKFSSQDLWLDISPGSPVLEGSKTSEVFHHDPDSEAFEGLCLSLGFSAYANKSLDKKSALIQYHPPLPTMTHQQQ